MAPLQQRRTNARSIVTAPELVLNNFKENRILDEWKQKEYFGMKLPVEKSFYLDKVWFQCEDDSCLKWRLLSKDDAAHVDQSKPWYCYLNTDPWYNTCSVPEEYYPAECQFERSGLKYVYSQLPMGSLVFVKLFTWPRWPGILCPDPYNGQYVIYDDDGNVESYHVEFLGYPHTRYWALVKHIKLYQPSFKPNYWSRYKEWYCDAMEEAKEIYPLSSEQRLNRCQLTDGTGMKKASENANHEKKGQKRKRQKETIAGARKCRRKKMCFLDCESENTYILSEENMVISETEYILKDLEQVLKQVAEPIVKATVSQTDKEDMNTREKKTGIIDEVSHAPSKVSMVTTPHQCSEVAPEHSDEEDYVIIDGIVFKTETFIESLTDQFQEIDDMIAEFRDPF